MIDGFRVNTQTERDTRTIVSDLDRRLAAPMFVITLVFLAVIAVVLHIDEQNFWDTHRTRVLWCLAIVYLLFPLEALLHWICGGRGLRQNLLFCLIPIARLGGRDHVDQSHVWLPVLGWQKITRQTSHRLMRYFGAPMIVIALMVVPVIAFELFFDELLAANPKLKLGVDATSAFIWASFAAEFVLVLSVVNNRLRFCRQNWMNIAVIVLPVVAFLRVIQLGRLLRLNQLVRTTRVFRLRGLVFRAWRGIVALDLIDMIIRRDPSVRLERTKTLIAEKQDEIDVLHHEVTRLERIVAARACEANEPCPVDSKEDTNS